MADYTQKLRDISHVPKNIEIAFITADFNSQYTDQIEEVTENFLQGEHFRNITKYRVPGAFEIPGMIQRVMEKKHFEHLIRSVLLTQLQLPSYL